MPENKPIILIISVSKLQLDRINAHLLSALKARANLEEVSTAKVAMEKLSCTPPPNAVLVTDAAVTQRKHHQVLDRLALYAKSGGIVVFACQFSSFVRPLDMGAMFKSTWKLSWTSG
ncbi:hypothetical protein CERSUDRAFT_96221 [Gelatoporia subvermispora B]|uniref:Uncharacterized protein n=1 Tax=Ceriporiopsis subvermispora (strain B) TaxID=914234 RepID=M2QG32_CERS8|nr:hypothetical protein CERSUDRAFT_96221 [Gelatoporia subvermispora B]